MTFFTIDSTSAWVIPIPMTVSITVPSWTKTTYWNQLPVTCSKTADRIDLYLDGVLKGSAYNTRTTTFGLRIYTIGKHQVSAVAYSGYEFGVDSEYTRVRFDITEPLDDRFSENLATDGYRHPNSVTVFDTQIRMIEQSSKSISQVSSNPLIWAEAIWEIMSDSIKIPWDNSNDWYTDIEMSNDYLTDNDLEPNKYACADFAVFISGLARSVGIPSRIWSLTGLDYTYAHMIAEVYIPGYNTNGEWLPMSISGNLNINRVNWEDYYEGNVAQQDNFRIEMGAREVWDTGFHEYRWKNWWIRMIWDITYISNSDPTVHQEKAWYDIDTAIPNGIEKISTSNNEFYDIYPKHLS